jgi:hypothetical protein
MADVFVVTHGGINCGAIVAFVQAEMLGLIRR